MPEAEKWTAAYSLSFYFAGFNAPLEITGVIVFS
jgi:hypothetical protein